jgi:hypothetical protein
MDVVRDGAEPPQKTSDNEQTKLEDDMITLDAFLVFLAAASLPVIYLLVVSRWIETEYRKIYPEAMRPQAPLPHRNFVAKPA